MYRQAGWRVPVLMAAGGDYEAYAALRMEFYALVHQTFFNTSLYFVATPAVLISWYCLRRNPWTARLLSLALFAAVSSFTLDRSPVGLALLMMLNFHLLTRPITRTQFVVGATGAISVIAAAHFLAGEPAGYAGRIDYLLVRVFYGQWMGLPFFFETFAQQRESLTALLPRALQTWFGEEAISPARSVMFLLAPEAVERGTAGVASAFFLGDAWAVGGVLGVLLAPLVVTAQIWVASLAFRLLPTNFFTSAVYSWFWFKLLMGILSGFSAFVSSALQAVLLVVVYAAVVRQLALAGRSRGSRPALQP
jgi:hypothetical protein